MQPSVFRRLQIATFGFLTVVVVALVISAALTAMEAKRLSEAQAQLDQLYEFDTLRLVISRRLTTLVEGNRTSPRGAPLVSDTIERMIALSSDPEVPGKLRELRDRLEQTDSDRSELAESLTLITEVGHAASSREAAVLGRLQAQTGTQLRLELAAPLAILAVGLLLFPLARQRIIRPLDAFGQQLARLADGEFTPAPEDDRVDPFLLPLHQQFNTLAHRLQSLESAHRSRTADLEAEVRTSTRQLLEQQRNLSRAERLAATGELAASVAHELRNPLAGIQMTLSNLRNELHDPEPIDRIDLVIGEVARLSRLLTELLETGRHAPEPLREVNVAEVVDDVLALTRCQLPTNVRLSSQVRASLTGRLPADRLRQALLNLLLNGARALGEHGGEIVVDAVPVGKNLRITVTDDGPGFPRELLEQGIRPYFSTRERGTGLGLAMVRRFARDVGGTIELANRSPRGAQVTLTLPANGEHA